MTRQLIRSSLGSALTLAAAFTAVATLTAQSSPLALESATITIAGTSNVHDYTATTTTVTLTRVQIGAVAGDTFWDDVQKAGGLQAFDLTIPAESLKSSKDGLDKNMYKALKTKEHANITFSLKSLTGTPGALTATGTLTVAGVAREVTLPLKTVRKGDKLAVSGTVDVMMPDHGIAPPKAMMGMVKAHPKITVTFEVLLGLVTT